jgi:hypothetical protein
MKNQKILTSPSTIKKELSFRIYRILILQRRSCTKNNLKFFKLYYFFQFYTFFQYFLKKNVFLQNYCISSIKHNNTFLKINKIFTKKLFVFNFVSFQNDDSSLSALSFIKNINYFNILFNKLTVFKFKNKTSFYLQFVYLIVYLHIYSQVK